MDAYANLLSPFRLGNMTLRNRIVSTPHNTHYPRDGYITEDYIRYYSEKAQGGVGLLQCFGSMSVHPTSPYQDWGNLKNWDDSSLPTFEAFATEMHRHGAKVMTQLTHRGRRGNSTVTEQPMVSASSVPETVNRYIPRPLKKPEIKEIVKGYAAAALRLKRAGFDGAEISAFARHLIDQFWSPQINQRSDEYGGSLENRLRFGVEVVEAAREAVGNDFVLGLRVSGDELLPGGRRIDGTKEIIAYMDALGCLDYFSVSGATGEPVSIGQKVIPAFDAPQAVYKDYASELKKITDKPVLLAGRIQEPEVGDRLVADGVCDLVGMTRALIADPHLPNKLWGRTDGEVKPCVAMQQGCVGRGAMGLYTGCTHNPVIGREQELATVSPALVSRRVLVVGGGPGGLEAARVAAERGHEVILAEAKSTLGGRVATSANAPLRPGWGRTTDWLVRDARRRGVDIRTGIEVTAAAAIEMKPDVVIVATGSRPHLPNVECVDDARVTSVEAILEHSPPIPPASSCIVIDLMGNVEGSLGAHALAAAGHSVTIVTPDHFLAETEEKSTREPAYEGLHGLGVEILTDLRVEAIHAGASVTVHLTHVYTGQEQSLAGAALVAFSAGARPRDEISEELEQRGIEVHVIGDALAPRGIHDAMLEGTRIAREL
ncbi:FAD-dependent oxidoreductase [uncultured Agrococcus sp.]|uniref:oxidoreductase n=1 Tax=uncultured Agrococcus sp. TaxID=382258 RepID=UPI0025EEF567|nr:FAD-dependent oxidoreductase [uncultured Agrococcus sp.]